jgi:hypothetical protein
MTKNEARTALTASQTYLDRCQRLIRRGAYSPVELAEVLGEFPAIRDEIDRLAKLAY